MTFRSLKELVFGVNSNLTLKSVVWLG